VVAVLMMEFGRPGSSAPRHTVLGELGGATASDPRQVAKSLAFSVKKRVRKMASWAISATVSGGRGLSSVAVRFNGVSCSGLVGAMASRVPGGDPSAAFDSIGGAVLRRHHHSGPWEVETSRNMSTAQYLNWGK